VNTRLLTSSGNIAYRHDALAGYYRDKRRTWAELYPSERWVIERASLEPGGLGRILDVGCAQGGLCDALRERFGVTDYVGVDIHPGLAALAREIHAGQPGCQFLAGDILELAPDLEARFGTVFSLSCADWNLRTQDILDACWRLVAPGGSLCLTLRLHHGPSVLDMESSHQVMARLEDPDAPDEGERAPYTVFNVHEALGMLRELGPERLLAYGYWGRPSQSAVTPLGEVVFTALSMVKPREEAPRGQAELHLPLDLFTHGAKP
jgi:SAM-dependent methyltransferase